MGGGVFWQTEKEGSQVRANSKKGVLGAGQVKTRYLYRATYLYWGGGRGALTYITEIIV